MIRLNVPIAITDRIIIDNWRQQQEYEVSWPSIIIARIYESQGG